MEIWFGDAKFDKGAEFKEEGNAVVKVEHFHEGPKVGQTHANNDARSQPDAIGGSVVFAAGGKDGGQIAAVGHAHDLKGVAGHFGLKEGQIGNASRKDHPSRQPRSCNLECHSGQIPIHPITLTALRRSHRNQQRKKIRQHHHDDGQEHGTRKRGSHIIHFPRKTPRRIKTIEVPKQIIQKGPPQHTRQTGKPQ
eukprot:scaffold67855_cov35-Attheya_sp.AAC.2